ncbi:MAG: aldehyde dehydrogenase family protein, partial [Corynebacterium casei]|nr:aldehyde dehydrogenase family protein [Corynebacterium casei]
MATQTHDQLLQTIQNALAACGYTGELSGGNLQTRTPLTGEDLFAIQGTTKEQATEMITAADEAYKSW